MKKTQKRVLPSLPALILLVALPAAGTYADEKAQSDCEYNATQLARGVTDAQLLQSCFIEFLNSAAATSARKSDDGTVLAFGYRNLLFVQHSGPKIRMTRQVQGGSETRLRQIQGIALDNANGEVLVLESNPPSILAFRNSQSGNIAPIRKISAPSIEGASALAVDSDHEELIVANSAKASVLFLSRTADVDGHQPRSSTATIRSIQGPATGLQHPQDVAVDPAHGEVFVLEKGAAEILVFSRSGGDNPTPLRILRGPATTLQGPLSIAYSAPADELQVFNGDGSLLRFPRLANGDSAPKP